MPQYYRQGRLQSREARRALPRSKEPTWHEVRRGLHLGYYRGTKAGTWWLREYRDGRHHKRRLGRADDDCFADGRTVFSFADALKIALTDERPTTAQVSYSYTSNEALDEYFTHRDARSTPTSVQSDRFAAARHIRSRLGSRQIASLRPEDLLRWRDALVPRTPDPELRRRAQVTANRAWSILRACLNLAFITGKTPSSDPWLRVRPFRNVDRPRQRFLTFPECKRLLNGCDPDFRQVARGALFTGLRLGELLDLRAIDVRGKYVHIEHSKSGKARDVPLSAQGREFFSQLALGKAGDERLFLHADGAPWIKMSVSRRMRAASAAARGRFGSGLVWPSLSRTKEVNRPDFSGDADKRPRLTTYQPEQAPNRDRAFRRKSYLKLVFTRFPGGHRWTPGPGQLSTPVNR